MTTGLTKRHKWGTFFSLVLLTLGVFCLIMVPLGFVSYNSFGFDLEYQENQTVVEDFYRVRWPGDGSLWVGGGSMHYSIEEEDVDPVDLAARMGQASEMEPSGAAWYRFAISKGSPENDKGELKFSTWLVIPSWGPALLLLIYPFVRFRARRTEKARAGTHNPK